MTVVGHKLDVPSIQQRGRSGWALCFAAMWLVACAAAPPPPGDASACASEEVEKLGWGASSTFLVDEEAVYWAANTGSIMRKRKSGGEAQRLAWTGAAGHERPDVLYTWMAADDDRIYWSDSGALRAVPKRGGPTVTLAERGCNGTPTLDNDSVYCYSESAVLRIPKRGGPPIRLAEGQENVSYTAVHDGQVYWSTFRVRPPCRGKDEALPPCEEVQWTGTCAVLRTDVNGESSPRVAEVVMPGHCGELVHIPGGLAVIEDNMLRAVSPKPDEAPLLQLTHEIVFDRGAAYFVHGEATLMRVATLGGSPEEVARDMGKIAGLALDREYIYWMRVVAGGGFNDSVIMRLPRRCELHRGDSTP